MQNRRQLTAAGLLTAGGLVSPALAQSNSSPQSLAERFAATLSAQDIDGVAAIFSDSYINHQVMLRHHHPPRMSRQNRELLRFLRHD